MLVSYNLIASSRLNKSPISTVIGIELASASKIDVVSIPLHNDHDDEAAVDANDAVVARGGDDDQLGSSGHSGNRHRACDGDRHRVANCCRQLASPY